MTQDLRPVSEMYFEDARDLFESARDAALDAHRCERQLEKMDEAATSIGSPAVGSKVSGGVVGDTIGAKVAALIDRKEALQARVNDDLAIVDLACCVLYGDTGMTGLASLAPAWWCDALFLYYLVATPWTEVAEQLGYSEQRCRQARDASFDLIDSWGMVGTIQGRALNSPEIWEADERRRAKKISAD